VGVAPAAAARRRTPALRAASEKTAAVSPVVTSTDGSGSAAVPPDAAGRGAAAKAAPRTRRPRWTAAPPSPKRLRRARSPAPRRPGQPSLVKPRNLAVLGTMAKTTCVCHFCACPFIFEQMDQGFQAGAASTELPPTSYFCCPCSKLTCMFHTLKSRLSASAFSPSFALPRRSSTPTLWVTPVRGSVRHRPPPPATHEALRNCASYPRPVLLLRRCRSDGRRGGGCRGGGGGGRGVSSRGVPARRPYPV